VLSIMPWRHYKCLSSLDTVSLRSLQMAQNRLPPLDLMQGRCGTVELLSQHTVCAEVVTSMKGVTPVAASKLPMETCLALWYPLPLPVVSCLAPSMLHAPCLPCMSCSLLSSIPTFVWPSSPGQTNIPYPCMRCVSTFLAGPAVC
jgi:hypothetical protein